MAGRPQRRTQRKGRLGRDWESVLSQVHYGYAGQRGVVIRRNEPPIKNLGRLRGGVFKACYDDKAAPDYTILLGGTFVDVEAKRTQSGRLRWESLRGHQAVAMDATILAGGAAFVAVLHADDHTGHLVPWASIREAWFSDRVRWERNRAIPKQLQEPVPRGSASASAADLSSRAIFTAPAILGWDYLPAIRDYIEAGQHRADCAAVRAAPAPGIAAHLKRDWKD